MAKKQSKCKRCIKAYHEHQHLQCEKKACAIGRKPLTLPLETRSRIIMENTDKLHGLSPLLFWDVDTTNFDIDKSADWLIPRVLEYGKMSDWHYIKHYYGMEKITSVCMNLRTLDPVALSFICCLSGRKKEDFRCYHFAQSFPTLWNS